MYQGDIMSNDINTLNDMLLRLELWLSALARTAPIKYHIIPLILKKGRAINIMVFDNKNNSIEINLCKGECEDGIMVGFTHLGEIITACTALEFDSVLNNPAEIVDINDYGELKIPTFLIDKCMYIPLNTETNTDQTLEQLAH